MAGVSVQEFQRRAAGLSPRGSSRGEPAGRELSVASALDERLSRLARGAGGLRLRLGESLEVLARRRAHHELGFSSFGAYVQERCARSVRWAQEARRLARRCEELTGLRSALLAGRMSWSRAEVVAVAADRETEAVWLEAARAHTVRQLREMTRQANVSTSAGDGAEPIGDGGSGVRGAQVPPRAQGAAMSAEGAPVQGVGGAANTGVRGPAVPVDPHEIELAAASYESDLGSAVLTVTVDRPDAWLFECASVMADGISGARSSDQVLEALIAEGATALFARIPREKTPDLTDNPRSLAQQAWERQRAEWRAEAERRCEASFHRPEIGAGEGPGEGADEGAPGPASDAMAPEVLDARIRELARELARREVELGRLAHRLDEAGGWRALGYATGRQYADERLGMGWSSLKQKRALARRLQSLPRLAAAVESGSVGHDAAGLVSRVATAGNEGAWVERARERTTKHLRQEVEAAELFARITGEPVAGPPAEDWMQYVRWVRGQVLSGAVFREGRNGQVSACCAEPPGGEGPESESESCEGDCSEPIMRDTCDGMGQVSAQCSDGDHAEGRPCCDEGRMPACSNGLDAAASLMGLLERFDRSRRGRGRSRARVTLRFRVSEETYRAYRNLERLFVQCGRPHATFLRFLSLCLIETWQSSFGSKVAYSHIYARDGFECSSPVCSRRDVTPHHLRFRSRGGDDSDENVASLCTWCHLEGVHGGRLGADPPASSVRWRIGRSGRLAVEGRTKIETAA